VMSLCHTFEDGTDTGYRNVGSKNSDAGEIPRRIYISFMTVLKLYSSNDRQLYDCLKIGQQ
jgi:hypothetical protein